MEAAVRSLARDERPEELPTALQRGRVPNLAALAGAVREELGEEWPPRIYGERVRSLRTRSHALPAAAKNARIEIQHTLLGVELKVGRKRVSCPDLSTARYLAVFARAGCVAVAVPYDISKISHLADRLEQGFERALLVGEHVADGRSDAFRKRLRRFIVEKVRREEEAVGPAEAVPQFKQSTRQRPPQSI